MLGIARADDAASLQLAHVIAEIVVAATISALGVRVGVLIGLLLGRALERVRFAIALFARPAEGLIVEAAKGDVQVMRHKRPGMARNIARTSWSALARHVRHRMMTCTHVAPTSGTGCVSEVLLSSCRCL